MKTLYLVVSLLIYIESVVAQAPGDASPVCLPGGVLGFLRFPIPENIKVLMESRDYDLLLGNQGETETWQQVDVDGIMGSSAVWTQQGALSCRQQVTVCGFNVGLQDNWLITQHISRQTDTLLPQVTVIVEYEFSSCDAASDCSRTFSVQRYDTSTINATAARDTTEYTQVANVAPEDITGDERRNDTINMDFTSSETGFYLAVRDQDSCLFITRIEVFYYVCPAVTENLIIFPEVLAPPISTTSQPISRNGQCVENASPLVGGSPILTCSQGGVWSIISGCTCNPGLSMNADGTACIECSAGHYAAVSSCLPCPANSNSTEPTNECPCLEGFYRNPSEGPGGDCALPPSAPLVLMVENRTDTTVFLTWEPPNSAGGGSNLEYELSFQPPGADSRTVFGRVSVTEGQITGLCQFLNYTLFVSSETTVTEPIPEELFTERSISISVTAAQPDRLATIVNSGVVSADNLMITWSIPDNTMVLLVTYRLTITNSSGIVVHDVMTNDTTFDASSLGLPTGAYSVKVIAVVNTDGCSGDLPVIVGSGATLTIRDVEDAAPDAIIIAVTSTVVGVAMILVLIASAIIIVRKKNLRCAYCETDHKVIEEIPEYASTVIVQLRSATIPSPPVPPPRIGIETNTAYGVLDPAMEKNPAYGQSQMPLPVSEKSNLAYGQSTTQDTPSDDSDEYEN